MHTHLPLPPCPFRMRRTPAPLAEVNFWKSRTIDLSGIHQQLERGVAHIVEVLDIAKSSYLPPFLQALPAYSGRNLRGGRQPTLPGEAQWCDVCACVCVRVCVWALASWRSSVVVECVCVSSDHVYDRMLCMTKCNMYDIRFLEKPAVREAIMYTSCNTLPPRPRPTPHLPFAHTPTSPHTHPPSAEPCLTLAERIQGHASILPNILNVIRLICGEYFPSTTRPTG